jgi:hypothetical protein
MLNVIRGLMIDASVVPKPGHPRWPEWIALVRKNLTECFRDMSSP